MKQAAATKPTTTSDGVKPLGHFGMALIDIGWQLAILVIGLLWLGNYADKHLHTKPLFVLLALAMVVAGFIVIVRRTVDKLPKEYGGKR